MIALVNVGKSYGDVVALADVSFELADGESLGIFGPSGAGKTTLLRLIAGLEAPESGRIMIGGEEVSSTRRLLPPHERSVGFVFQESALWPHMTVAQNILFGLGSWPRQAARARLDDLLEAIVLAPLASRRPGELSTGQVRRVALARALAPQPRHLLLDEPMANLDTELRDAMISLVCRERDRFATNLVVVSHDPDEVGRLADRTLRLSEGS